MNLETRYNELNKDYGAYELVNIEKLNDLNSVGLLLKHKKSGARVAIISNDDDVEFNEYNNIVICSDKNVVRSMGVLVYSIIKNTKTKCAFHIFFNGNMPIEDVEKFTYLSKKYSVPIVIYYINKL